LPLEVARLAGGTWLKSITKPVPMTHRALAY